MTVQELDKLKETKEYKNVLEVEYRHGNIRKD